jgi:sporulation integral membrane protein YlbJ
MIFFPSAVFQASKVGISAWWNIAFPALLPFFITSELMAGYGIIQFMGVLLEPVMRPLFNLPGAASFVMAVGYTSGFPISASLAARLRKDKICTRFEAERLMCFTNNSSPLFMLIAVGVGMFNSPGLGVIIAVSHYMANVFLGLALRFYKREDARFLPKSGSNQHIWQKAMVEMKNTLRNDPRPFGKIMGDAVASSINKLLVIGGFIIVFSVIIKISEIIRLTALLNTAIGILAIPFGLSEQVIHSLSCGFFEITLGTKAAAEAAGPLSHKLAAASIILGWSGVSVLAQVSAMITETDLKMGMFVLCRLAHSLLAGALTILLMSSQAVRHWVAQPVMSALIPYTEMSWTANLLFYSRLCIYTLAAWLLLAIIVYIIRSFAVIKFRV